MMGKWSDDSACSVVHDGWLYSVLDTMVISSDNVCCSLVFGTLDLQLVVLCGHQRTSAREWSVRLHLR